MELSLKKLKHFETTNGEHVRVVDAYIDITKARVQQFICRVGRFSNAQYFIVKPDDLLASTFNRSDHYIINHSIPEILKNFKLWDYDSLIAQKAKDSVWYSDFPHPTLLSPWSFRDEDKNENSLENQDKTESTDDLNNDPYIYSFKQLQGSEVESPDNSYGRLDDILITPDGHLQYLVVNIGHFFRTDYRIINASFIKQYDNLFNLTLISLRGMSPLTMPTLTSHENAIAKEEELNAFQDENLRKEIL